jgi:hypothetical protein
VAELNPIATGNLVPIEQDLKRSVFLAGIVEASTIKEDFHPAGGEDRLRFGPRLIAEQARRLVAAFSLINFHI